MPAPLLHTLTFFGLALLIFGTAALVQLLRQHFFTRRDGSSQAAAPAVPPVLPEAAAEQTDTDDGPFPQCLVKKHNFLVHFTRAENLDSILRYGLLPRDRLEELAPAALCNDSTRQDERCYTVSLSLEFPNDRMFYKYRREEEERGGGHPWCVLLWSPAILAEKDCMFCAHNASCADMRDRPDSMLATRGAYDAMFAAEGRSSNLPPEVPTDAQAEILVAGIVSPRYLLHVVFEYEKQAESFRRRHPESHALCDPRYFLGRQQAYEKK